MKVRKYCNLHILLITLTVFVCSQGEFIESAKAEETPATQQASPTLNINLPKDFSISKQLGKKPDQTINKTISRKLVNEGFKEYNDQLKSFVLVPVNSEQFCGFLVQWIKPGSLLENIGYKKDDILMAYRGKPLGFSNMLPMLADLDIGPSKSETLLFRDGKFVVLRLQVQD